MKKVAVIVAPGFEEGETLTIVDIIRRAHFQCDMFGFDKVVEGGHGICVQCDKIFIMIWLFYLVDMRGQRI